MSFTLSEEQTALRTQARRFLEDRSPSSAVRRLMATENGHDPDLWAEMAVLGWLGVHIPEAYGGTGLGPVELALLLEEQGRALLCAPFFSTTCLAVNALLVAGSEEHKRRYLPAIAQGRLLATVACAEPNARWDARGITLCAVPDGDGHVLHGTKTFVLDGMAADLLLVAARTAAADAEPAEGGISLFLVEAVRQGVTRQPLVTMDATRKQARIDFDQVRVGPDALLGPLGTGWTTLADVFDRAALGLAVEQVGAAEKVLDMALDYAKLRTAFGRPIGGFQAIKHKFADMLQDIESARSVAYHGAALAAAGSPELPRLASLAKAYCCEAGHRVAQQNILIHGGIGFTWEHDAHLYFKRAKSSSLLFGDAAYHHERLAAQLGLAA